jgi:hypothetical protein
MRAMALRAKVATVSKKRNRRKVLRVFGAALRVLA